MNGFVHISPTFSLGAIQSLQTTAEALYVPPVSGTAITGLQSGTTMEISEANSIVLQNAFDNGLGTLDLIIPTGTWQINTPVTVNANTTLTFEGKLTQIFPTSDIYNFHTMMTIVEGNVILNNPLLDMGGLQREPDIITKSGTHSTLAIYGTYNTGNITINGGILEGGSSNNFQGGRNNTVFNGTTLRNSREHLVYASGISGDGVGGGGDADGLIFNNCIFENPGIGDDPWESNHIQLRHFKNVAFNGCTISGSVENGHGQYGFLMTNITNATITDTSINGYNAGLCWVGYDSVNVKFIRCEADGNGSQWSIRKGDSTGTVTYDDCILHRPRRAYNNTDFINTTLDIENEAFAIQSGSLTLFNDCTFDLFTATTATAMTDAGTTSFTGTTIRVCSESGVTTNWGPIPGTCP